MKYDNEFNEPGNSLFLDSLNEYVILLNNSGDILYLNKSLLKRLQYSNEELLKSNIGDITFDKNIKKVIKKEPSSYYLKVFTKNGNVVNLDIKVIKGIWKSKNTYCIIGKEIEDKVYLRSDLEDLFENIPYYAWIKDCECRYVYVNKSFLEFIGKNKEEIYGKTTSELLSGRIKGKDFILDEQLERNKEEVLSEEKLYIDGKESIMECYKKPILDQCGDIKASIGIARNMTLKRLTDKEVIKEDFDLLKIYNLFDDKNKKIQRDSLLKDLGPHIVNRFDARGVCIYLYDSNEKYINLYSIYGLEEAESEELCKWINRNNIYTGLKEIYSNKLNGMYRWRSNLDYIALYPIKFEGKTIGLLLIGYQSSCIPIHIKNILIDAICNQLGIIIKNNILFDEVKENLEKKLAVEEDMNMLFDSTNELISVIDKDRKFIKVNKNWKRDLGWSSSEILGKDFLDYVHPDERAESKLVSDNRYERYKLINRQVCKDGSYKWISWQIRHLKDRDIFISSGKDITEALIMERKNKMLEESMKLEEIKSEYFANMSHELKTPLNIILSTMQLLDSNIKEKRIYANNNIDLDRYVKSIRQNSYRLLRLVNNIIDQSKIDTGYFQLQKGNYDIVKIVEDITLSVVELVENKGITLIFDTNIEEKIIACDYDKIERIMLNLLSNATKYTQENGEIFVKVKCTEEGIMISVKDNGIGIPQNRLENIFNRFEQVDNKITRNSLGSGIGLYLVKSFVEIHGGKITVKSEEGKGTEFKFIIPDTILEEVEDYSVSKELTNNTSEKCNIEFSNLSI
ncbi:PAS domain S-box protein [Clostridium chauvoei]|uniref:sensor histidine kinase n=1 Tax=Clostridium chauvoei TaxID=46867 RepID=UPI001C848BC7|nr:PAS domain S-box protein [Clostridium chauvoei]MBX7421071.1 PAS domain S-box protein [Clostridium chauvoei]